MTDTLRERLTQSVRRLIDVTIRSEADGAAVANALALVDQAVELLSTRLMPGSFGVRTTADGKNVVAGNVAIGVHNPIAPPLIVQRDAAGGVHADVHLGAGYEGPPGHVHGGMCALILDHLLGATAHQPGKPAYTGTITVRYLRPTRLGALRAEARLERIDGNKTYAVGHLGNVDGVTVEAEGVFITPLHHSAGIRPTGIRRGG
ncbi:PaaI family thioesterase [Mycobacterium arosiense]|uniref:Acyl-coenzyme A thioesterase THEM4 n=1 Tax=Mycobacterium arosiense ATCC BAA-1401 = DSM 45069 TaxID=1265311 RepID=A0A1W9ZIH4_MYCAI|nr:PaaI family thioesterase [Mycobacterium arosiense]ORA15474.1 thioesterase [Mycobacterium arosiense ATCC BAA-1401 = DSM 45069]